MRLGRQASTPSHASNAVPAEDGKKSSRKIKLFLSDGEDPVRRLKALREYCESSTTAAQSEVFIKNFYRVFEVLLDSFLVLEVSIRNKQLKGSPTDAKLAEFETVTFVMSRIFALLSGLIQKGWQENGFALLLEKFLVHENSQNLRRDGFTLLLQWIVAFRGTPCDHAARLFRGAIKIQTLRRPGEFCVIHQDPITVKTGIVLSPAGPESPEAAQEHVLELVGLLLDFIFNSITETGAEKVDMRMFEYLFTLFKDCYLVSFYPAVFKRLGILPANDDSGFSVLNPAIQQLIVKTFAHWHLDPSPKAIAIRKFLHSSQVNTEICLEIFKQAFLLPMSYHPAISDAVHVYTHWVSSSTDTMPDFMREPDPSVDNTATHRLGAQRTVQLLIESAAHVFNSPSKTTIDKHFSVCLDVLSFFQFTTVQSGHWKLNQVTWEILITTLMDITKKLLLEPIPPETKHLSSRIVSVLLETLLVSWVRAQVCFFGTQAMWTDLRNLLVSLVSSWFETIEQWKSIMLELTIIMSRSVYSIDFDKLPLDVLTPQRSQKHRSAGTPLADSQSGPHRVASLSTHEVAHHHEAPLGVHQGSSRRIPHTQRSMVEIKSTLPADPQTSTRSQKPNRIISIEEIVFNPAISNAVTDIRAKPVPVGMDKTVYQQFLSIRDMIWSPHVAMFTWKNMLSICGNINEISSPPTHAAAMSCLVRIHAMLVLVRDNQGIPTDNSSTAVPPKTLPPLNAFLTWVFEACMLSDRFAKGRAAAYGLLCRMVVRRHDRQLPEEYLSNFYRVLHHGLSGDRKQLDIVTEIMHNCEDLFMYCFDGFGVILVDWLDAVDHVLNKENTSVLFLRQDVVRSISSLVCFGTLYAGQDVPKFISNGAEIVVQRVGFENIKITVLDLISQIASSETHVPTRCIAISGLAVSIYHDLLNHSGTVQQLSFRLEILLNLIRAEDMGIATLAVSMIDLLSEVSVLISALDHKIVETVVEAITNVIGHYLQHGENKDEILTQLLFCLMDWLMVDQSDVLHNRDLNTVIFHVLSLAIEGYGLSDEQSAAAAAAAAAGSASVNVDPSTETNDTTTLSPPGASGSPVQSAAQMPKVPSAQAPDLAQPSAVLSKDYPVSPTVTRANNTQKMFEPAAVGARLADMLGNAEHTMRGVFKRKDRSRRDDTAQPAAEHLIRIHGHDSESVVVAARTVLNHLLHHDHCFPGVAGVARIISQVSEFSDNPSIDSSVDDLTPQLFRSNNVEFFVYNTSTIISLVEIPNGSNGETLARVIVRDLTGKYVWDSRLLFCAESFSTDTDPHFVGLLSKLDITIHGKRRLTDEHITVARRCIDGMAAEAAAARVEVENNDTVVCSPHSVSNFAAVSPSTPTASSGFFREQSSLASPPVVAPSAQGQPFIRKHRQMPVWSDGVWENGVDMLEETLLYVGESSAECLFFDGEPLNVPYPPLPSTEAAEKNILEALEAQSSLERTYLAECEVQPPESMIAAPILPSEVPVPVSPFQKCRLILSHLGLLSWENRKHIHMLEKSDQMLRILKQLDKKAGVRDYHKIGVVYVAPGQEDEHSILMNDKGSALYENFLAGVGWEVDIAQHAGFNGQLVPEKNGTTTPYYATSTIEVIFHVATRMPSGPEPVAAVLNKKKHIGNDRVQIVWTEHTRAYRPDIIRSRFNDAIIVISPLSNGLFHIGISKRPEVPTFGPLFDGAIVDVLSLAPLVRATAVNANRAVLGTVDGFKRYYEQRFGYVEDLINNHSLPSTYEEFLGLAFKLQGDDMNGSRSSISSQSGMTMSGAVLVEVGSGGAPGDGGAVQSPIRAVILEETVEDFVNVTDAMEDRSGSAMRGDDVQQRAITLKSAYRKSGGSSELEIHSMNSTEL